MIPPENGKPHWFPGSNMFLVPKWSWDILIGSDWCYTNTHPKVEELQAPWVGKENQHRSTVQEVNSLSTKIRENNFTFLFCLSTCTCKRSPSYLNSALHGAVLFLSMAWERGTKGATNLGMICIKPANSVLALLVVRANNSCQKCIKMQDASGSHQMEHWY